MENNKTKIVVVMGVPSSMRISFIIHDYHQNRNSYPMGTACLASVLIECGELVMELGVAEIL